MYRDIINKGLRFPVIAVPAKIENMKKIFTLALGLLMTAALFAADRRPTVMLNSSRDFEVVIDGRSYETHGRTINLRNLYNGRHSIKVFEMKRGRFGYQKKLVSQSSFRVRGNDMLIRVAFNGQIMIRERSSSYIGYGSGKDGRDFRNDRDNRFDPNDRDNRFDPNDRRDGNKVRVEDKDWDDNDERDWRDNFNK